MYIPDSNTWTPIQTLLYDGVEQDKNGNLRIKIRDRSTITTLLANHLGLTRHPKTTLADILHDPSKLSDAQIDSILLNLNISTTATTLKDITPIPPNSNADGSDTDTGRSRFSLPRPIDE
jgi:hypothetical protein